MSVWDSRGVGGRGYERVFGGSGQADYILCSRRVFEWHSGDILLQRGGFCQICKSRSRLCGGACGYGDRLKLCHLSVLEEDGKESKRKIGERGVICLLLLMVLEFTDHIVSLFMSCNFEEPKKSVKIFRVISIVR